MPAFISATRYSSIFNCCKRTSRFKSINCINRISANDSATPDKMLVSISHGTNRDDSMIVALGE